MVIAVYLIRYGVAVMAIVYLNLSSQLPIDNDIASKLDVTAGKPAREHRTPPSPSVEFL